MEVIYQSEVIMIETYIVNALHNHVLSAEVTDRWNV